MRGSLTLAGKILRLTAFAWGLAGCGPSGGPVAEVGTATKTTLQSRQAVAAKPTLNQVRSFVYVTGAGTDSPGFTSAIANSAVDLIIMGGGSYDSPLNRAATDPQGTKLLCGYVTATMAAEYMFPELFAGGKRPSWFGKEDQGFPGLYTVQYWNPAWRPALLSKVDTIIDRGYDCVFLDTLDGDTRWSSGNAVGNPTHAEALPALADLLAGIRLHVNASNLARPFYLIGNNPTSIAKQHPEALRNLDAALQEWAFWGPTAADGTITEFKGTLNAQYVASVLAPIYKAAGLVVLGNDYPLPLSDPAKVLPIFEYYTELGWIPSVISAAAARTIFDTGPFMFMATPTRTTVAGRPDSRNFLSGGVSSDVTLVGGNHTDYFIGGPGTNTIRGGGGDDVIYPHPAKAAVASQLVVVLSATNKNSTTPSVTLRVNGQVVAGPTQLTAAWSVASQTFQATVSGPPSSVELEVSGTSYANPDNFSNVVIERVSYRGETIDLAGAQFENGAANPGYAYSNNGKVSFGAASFANVPAYPVANTSIVDGGAGRNTVYYRGPRANYTLRRDSDGSWHVHSASTAEGPDILTNVQRLVFTDSELELGDTISDARVFAFASASFPALFGGAPALGRHEQYSYAYFPPTGNYLALDTTGEIWVLGPISNGVVQRVGPLSAYSSQILAWEARQTKPSRPEAARQLTRGAR